MASIEVTSIVVDNQFSVDALLVSWSVSLNIHPLSDYAFDILRYQTPELDVNNPTAGATIVATDLHYPVTSYLDASVNLFKPDASYYYRIRARYPTEADYISPIYGEVKLQEPDAIAYAIWFQYQHILEVAGNVGYILLRKRYGQRCAVCWDDIQQQATRSNCLACYGTTYQGGYLPPIQTYYLQTSPDHVVERFNIDDNNSNVQLTPQGIWLVGYPRIQPGDIFVDANNDRYRISDVQYSLRKGFILRQQATMEALQPTHITYQIPIL